MKENTLAGKRVEVRLDGIERIEHRSVSLGRFFVAAM